MSGAGLAPLFAGLLCLAAAAAHANGRLPGATGLAINPSDEHQLLLGLTYGLAHSRDGGASWSWMCEQQIEGNGGDVDPSIVVTSNGTLVVLSLTNGGVLVSRNDGCSFERAKGPLQGERGVDLTLDPSRPGRVLSLMSSIVGVVDNHPLYHNFLAHSLDHGGSWEVLAELPADMSAETVEVAPSDAERIYVSGTAAANPLRGIVERSDDGGLSWTRTTTQLPFGSGSLFLSGIHPNDPDRLWFRVPGLGDIYGVLPARLWLSTDGGASFDQVADTQGGMLGFAISPDGDQVAFGGPLDGLFVAPAKAGAVPSKVSDLQVSCLRWRANGVYACGFEPTDPYSLGFADEPTQDFVPLWHRADTCQQTCAAPSPLEMNCREPWEEIAPWIDAGTRLCDDRSPVPDAGIDAWPDDAEPDAATDASPETPRPTDRADRASAGCAVAFGRDVGMHGWPAALLTLALGMRMARRASRRRACHPKRRPVR